MGDLPENDDPTLVERKKGVHRFHDRTAGILALVRPCGVIVNTAEMYTCESPTQVYLFIVMIRTSNDFAISGMTKRAICIPFCATKGSILAYRQSEVHGLLVSCSSTHRTVLHATQSTSM